MWRAKNKDTHWQSERRIYAWKWLATFNVYFFGPSFSVLFARLLSFDSVCIMIIYRCYCFNERLLGCQLQWIRRERENSNKYANRFWPDISVTHCKLIRRELLSVCRLFCVCCHHCSICQLSFISGKFFWFGCCCYSCFATGVLPLCTAQRSLCNNAHS